VSKPWVCILMGSDSDALAMSQAAKALDELEVPYEMLVASAHRTPDRTRRAIEDGEKNGAAVFIAGAGAAAHLPGVVASFTMRPVIGVPLQGSPLFGLDALFAIAQMPAGVPVATVAIGPAGARNAGILAAQILAISDPKLAARLRKRRQAMADSVVERSKKVEKSTRSRKR
jgi:5-(carboxyamino)imidazole ribonucleotide mutase